MSEEMMSGEERNSILKQVFTPEPISEHKDINTPKRSGDKSEAETDLSQVPFGSLLEQTIAIRERQAEEDVELEEHIDDSRAEAIKNSRMDILEGWRL